jgi:hypothetical protein
MAVFLIVALIGTAGWLGYRAWVCRASLQSRVLSIATVVATVVPSIIWLQRAAPGKSLAELAPGFSMAGAFETAAAIVFSLAFVVAGIVVTHPPRPRGPAVSRLRRAIDLLILVALFIVGVSATGLTLWATRDGMS